MNVLNALTHFFVFRIFSIQNAVELLRFTGVYLVPLVPYIKMGQKGSTEENAVAQSAHTHTNRERKDREMVQYRLTHIQTGWHTDRDK